MNTEAVCSYPGVRFLTTDDIDRVMQIEQSAYPFPWTRGIFEDCLRVGYDCRGLELDSCLLGYAVQTQFAGECHLLNLCIEPAWQGRGFGSLMLEETIRQARFGKCSSVFLEVRPSNRAGKRLYRKRGFYVAGERPDYYRASNGRENAIIMRLDLEELPDQGLLTGRRYDPF